MSKSHNPSTDKGPTHTPGPWSVRQSRADLTYTHIGSATNESIACTKSEADAKLIAAAPDLLEALVELSGWQSTAPRSALQAAYRAIEKARG